MENRGNFVKLHRDPATGDVVSDGIIRDFRTPHFSQTDFAFNHEFKVSKSNEALRLGFEWSVQNLLNEHSVLSINPNPLAAGAVAPKTTSNATGIDWQAFLAGWDYIGITNAQKKTFNARYGLPFLFQTNRNMRFKIKFMF